MNVKKMPDMYCAICTQFQHIFHWKQAIYLILIKTSLRRFKTSLRLLIFGFTVGKITHSVCN